MIDLGQWAAGIVSTVKSLASQFGVDLGGAPGSPAAQPADLAAAAAELKAACVEACQRDDNDANSWLTRLGQLWEHGFGYAEERRKIKELRAALVADVEDWLRRIETMARGIDERAKEALPQLRAHSSWWVSAAQSADTATQAVRAVSQIPGWSGPTAEGYSRAADAQAVAGEQLAKAAATVGMAHQWVANLNVGLTLEARGALAGAAAQVRGAAGSGALYSRLAAAKKALVAATDQVRPIANLTEGREKIRDIESQLSGISPDEWPASTNQEPMSAP